jgi:DNA-binding MarR family transcriptional regulator/predicted transcriptional regulator
MAHKLRPKKQLEMPLALGSLALTKSQAACLRAIGQGIHSKSQIAIAAQLDLAKALRALDALANLCLVKKSADHQWRKTRLGRSCRYRIIGDKRRRGWNGLGQGAQRLLEALSRPMSGRELARDLKITKQRVHQLVVKLHGMGHVRLGDQERILHVVARRDDPVPLLSRDEQSVFSAIAEQYDTTPGKIRQAAGCSEAEAEDTLRHLVDIGLVAKNTKANGLRRYQITKAGSLHPQYQRSTGHADPPSLVVRSDRVLAVLSLLAERGRAQITEVRDALGLPHRSINALFQYLKRKSLVRKDGKDLRAPYRLTDEGSEALAELRHRRAA